MNVIVTQDCSNLEHDHIPENEEYNGAIENSIIGGPRTYTGCFSDSVIVSSEYDVGESGSSHHGRFQLRLKLPKDGDKESKPFNFTKILWKRIN